MNMRTTRLIAVLVGLAAIAMVAADAKAYYHPGMGRFMSRDPGPGGAMRVGGGGPAAAGGFIPRDPTGSNQYADGMNLYQYVSSNPANYVDPMGTKKKKLPVPSSPTTSTNYHKLKDRTDCCDRVTERTMTAYWTDEEKRKRFIDHLGGTGARFGVDNVNHLLQTLDKNLRNCQCIRKLTINSHGGYAGEGGFRMTSPHGSGDPIHAPDMIAHANSSAFGSALAGAMCDECYINVMSCGAADGNTLKNIAKASGCKVRGTVGTFTRRTGWSIWSGRWSEWVAQDGVMECDPSGTCKKIHGAGSKGGGVW
jgi:hypothetical protein